MPLKKRNERAHQYRVMSERLRFHLTRENLPEPVAQLVQAAEKALLDASELLFQPDAGRDRQEHREEDRQE